MESILKYRIYCITEDKFVYKLFEKNEMVNLICFNDHTHEINQNSLLLVDRLEKNEVIISEENIKTQGNLRCQGYDMVIPQNSTQTYTVSFNYNVNLTCVIFDCKDENIGHKVSACLVPFVQGSLLQNCDMGSSILFVDNISLLLANLGYNLTIKRMSDNFDCDLGEIIEINKINSTIKTEFSLNSNFLSGDLLYFKVYGIRNMTLGSKGRYSLGSNKIGSSFIDDRNTIDVIYTNTSNVDVNFNFITEYLY